MTLTTFKCNNLAPLHFKALSKTEVVDDGFSKSTKRCINRQTTIGVNLYKAPRPEPPHFLKSKSLRAFEPPLFVRYNLFFAYYEAVFHSVTNNKMKLNDIHATFI